MDRFYWLVPRVLAGSSRPGGRYGIDGLDDHLSWLRSQGIGAILALTEEPPDLTALERHGIISLHLPVIDFTPPSPDQFTEALGFIDRQSVVNVPVVVHCYAGQGRTGTVLAAYLIRAGRSPEQAIIEVREVCPRAVENDLQLAALEAYSMRRDWIV
jgi:atypical dual specificity phosphatase